MYKPLSLVISKSNRDFEHSSFFKVYSLLSHDKSRNNTVDASMRRVAGDTVLPEMLNQDVFQEKPQQVNRPVARPRCIRSYRSDRVAIYDEQGDTFHAYSVTEAISQPGLTFQEAVDWIDDRLVLVGNGMTPGNFTVALSLILASWAAAILLIAMVIKFIF